MTHTIHIVTVALIVTTAVAHAIHIVTVALTAMTHTILSDIRAGSD